MNEENKFGESSKVDELSDTLYSRTRYRNPMDKRPPVRPVETPEVNPGWQSPPLDEILTRDRKIPEIHPFLKKLFIFALLFFTATIAVAGVIFLGGSNFVSSKNVDIEVLGPTNTSAGEVMELGVTIKNGNNTDLVAASFSVQYPSGTRDPEDTTKPLVFTKTDLGAIGAGDEVVKNIPMVLIGTTGETKEIKFSVEYKIKGSNATFYKDKVYEMTIGESPMSISVDSPSVVQSGESFVSSIKVKLNSAAVLRNAMLKAEYPYGFSPLSSSPEAAVENNVWALGDLTPGVEKTVQITGKLVGENQDERTFRFYAGVADGPTPSPDFKSVIISTQETVAIERPSIGLNIAFNGETSPVYVAPAGGPINATIRVQNNLPEKIINPRLEVRLSGSVLDKLSVKAQGNGFYNSSNNTVSWTIYNLEEAQELLPGQDATVTFSFASLPEPLPVGSKDISLQVILSGKPAGSKNLSINESRTVKIASQVNLTSRIYHSMGPFKNSGPIPPKVEATTTYAIIWNVGNTQSDITEAKVTAKLGQGVRIASVQSAGAENFSYDDSSNSVTWDMGTLSSGSGFSTNGREMAFQVALTPSLSQLGTAPILVSGIVFTGIDSSTGSKVSATAPPLTTRLPHDPAFIQGDDLVRK